jgi:polyhydroxyalkanoate synthesis regulator phasin
MDDNVRKYLDRLRREITALPNLMDAMVGDIPSADDLVNIREDITTALDYYANSVFEMVDGLEDQIYKLENEVAELDEENSTLEDKLRELE